MLWFIFCSFHWESYCSAWYMGRKGLLSCFDFLGSKSLLFWNFCTLRGFGAFIYLECLHLHTHFCLKWLGGIIKEVGINTNAWNLASNGLMFTKQKQGVKGLVQFMGEGKQLGRSFDSCSILKACQKSESVMHPSTALLLIIQWCKRKKSVVS